MSYQTINYQELHERADDEHLESFAIKVNQDDRSYHRISMTQGGSLALESGAGQQWELADDVVAKMCNDAQIPLLYADRCPIDLLHHNLSHWYSNDEFFYRMVVEDNKVIALNKPTFTSIPTKTVLDAVDSTLENCSGEFTPRVVRADGHSYVVYYAAEDIELDTRGGGVQGALELRTSPVGKFTTRICPATFQLICDNGMVTGRRAISGVNMRHAGRDVETIMESLVNVIPLCCDAVHDELRNLRRMENVPVESLESAFRLIRSRYATKLSQSEITTILDYLENIRYVETVAPVENAFDVIAAITYAAQRCGFDMVTASRLEELSGHFLHDIVDESMECSTCGHLLIEQ